jgi:hypothetical protein
MSASRVPDLDIVIALLADDHDRQRKGNERGEVVIAAVMELIDDEDFTPAEEEIPRTSC